MKIKRTMEGIRGSAEHLLYFPLRQLTPNIWCKQSTINNAVYQMDQSPKFDLFKTYFSKFKVCNSQSLTRMFQRKFCSQRGGSYKQSP